MPEWRRIEPYFNSIGLFIILVFPILAGVPVFGYLIETAALVFVILFALQRRQLLLTIGSIGSILISSLVFGPSLIILGIWAIVVIPGTIFGRLVSQGFSPPRVFLMTMIISSLISLIVFWSEKQLIFEAMDEILKWMQSVIVSGAGAAEDKSDMINWTANMVGTIKRLMPALMALSAAAQLFAAGVLVMFALKMTGHFVPTFGNFLFWKMSFNYLYLAGLFIVIRLIGTDGFRIVADNILFFMGIFYAVFGFSVIEYFLRRIKASIFLRLIFYVGFIFLQLPGLVFAAILGIFDSYFDFRHVRARIIG